MFDNFFEKHKPDNEVVTSSESVERIDALLREKMPEPALKEEKPMKKGIKRILLVAIAAAVSASALLFSGTADYEGDEEYIVRINGKRVDAEINTYREGKIKFETISYELPCEIFIDKNGKPVTEDSDVDRRVVKYIGTVYSYEDPEMQVYIPDEGVHIDRGFDGFCACYSKDAMLISGLPSESGSENMLPNPAVIYERYDEGYVKEFWENYWKDPENESKKWAEYFKERSAHEDPSSWDYPWEDHPYDDVFEELYNEMVIKKYAPEEYQIAE